MAVVEHHSQIAGIMPPTVRGGRWHVTCADGVPGAAAIGRILQAVFWCSHIDRVGRLGINRNLRTPISVIVEQTAIAVIIVDRSKWRKRPSLSLVRGFPY